MSVIQVVSKTLRVMGPNVTELDEEDREPTEQQIESVVQNLDWSMIEQLVSDSMPNGYYCKIEDAG